MTTDPVLQSIVHQARECAAAPVALVSLVLDYTRFVRAMTGLRPTVEPSRAAAVCDAFCQLVARDDWPWIVEDLADPRDLPASVGEELAVRAYLGHPVYLREKVVGSLCVVDAVPRGWPQTAWEGIAELAERAGARLVSLTGTRGPDPSQRARDELTALVQLMKALDEPPYSLDDARVALSVLGQPVDLLNVLQHDPGLREEIQERCEVDLSELLGELRSAGGGVETA